MAVKRGGLICRSGTPVVSLTPLPEESATVTGGEEKRRESDREKTEGGVFKRSQEVGVARVTPAVTVGLFLQGSARSWHACMQASRRHVLEKKQ